MNQILRITIASGLEFLFNTPKIITNLFPDNVFGVFVGIERSSKYKLNYWPYDIHGCIGYWDPKYSLLSDEFILNKIITVSHLAATNDERREYFIEPLHLDLNAIFKIYFMNYPITVIDSNTGIMTKSSIPFNNKKYGLIVEDLNDKLSRATYLPGVFPDKSWSEIKELLIKKSGITNQNIIFYAYECKIFSMTIADYFLLPIQKFFNKYYTDFVPHTVINNEILIDKTDFVRNLAMIADLLKMNSIGYTITSNTKRIIKSNIEYYNKLFDANPNSMRQASAFLLLCNYYFDGISNPYIQKISSYLHQQLESGNLEKNFELGEILYALNTINPHDPIVSDKTKKLPLIDIDSGTNIDIFRYNWFSKSVPYINDKIYKYTLIKKIKRFIDKNKYDETNYYAVEFESLAMLYSNISDKKTKISVGEYLIQLITKLDNRKNDFGLYQFKNKTARVDITGHVLNGLFLLI